MSEPFRGAESGTDYPDAVKWRLFEIHRSSMASVGRSQSKFVTALLSYLALLWGWNFMKPPGMAVQFLGASLSPSGLWVITPAVLTVLSCGLIGTMNAMGPVWKRLSNCAETLGIKVFWYDLDTNKNIIDYLTYLRIRPEGAVEPVTPPKDISRKFHLSVFSYPAILAGSITTTCFADYPGAPVGVRLYIYGCAAAQGLYSIRIWYRAVCRFFAVRREQTEI